MSESKTTSMFATRKLSDAEWICQHVLPQEVLPNYVPKVPHETGLLRLCRTCYLEYRQVAMAEDTAGVLAGLRRVIGHLHDQHDRIDKMNTLMGMYTKNTDDLRIVINSILRRERDRDVIALD